MIVTLFTDASYHYETKAAGWGAWAKSDRGLVTAGGSIKEKAVCPTTAEIMAILNGIHVAASTNIACEGDRLIIQSDSLYGMRFLSGDISKLSRTYKAASQFDFKERFATAAKHFTFEFRHVRAHQGGIDKRSWVNELCDDLAKRGMRRARKAKVINNPISHLEVQQAS